MECVAGELGLREIVCQSQPSAPGMTDAAAADPSDPSDRQVEKMEQERLVVQLREMIRERESSLAIKDAELRVRFALQSLIFDI